LDADTKWEAFELKFASSASLEVLAKKMAKPDTKAVSRTISILKTAVIEQSVQQPRKSAAIDAARTVMKPISPQKLLFNEQSS
jgi:hypothetical protein